METILATAFGYKVELLRGKVDGGDELIKAAQDIFNIPIDGGMASVILFSLNCKCYNILDSFSYYLLYSSSSLSLVDTSHEIDWDSLIFALKICYFK